jgi:hypothetical protein
MTALEIVVAIPLGGMLGLFIYHKTRKYFVKKPIENIQQLDKIILRYAKKNGKGIVKIRTTRKFARFIKSETLTNIEWEWNMNNLHYRFNRSGITFEIVR